MLATHPLPPEYAAWNRRWGAPFGRTTLPIRLVEKLTPDLLHRFPRIRGPFAIQPNNDTRRFEYPWAYFATPLVRGMRVLELGGGLAGFQFVLAKEGLDVLNVDPGEGASGVGWPCDNASIDRLNHAFGTDVRLANTTLDQVDLPAASVDRIFSISTIEHIPAAELTVLAEHMHRILKPGGLVVLTIDLFLDLAPFTRREQNKFGENIDVKAFVDLLGLEKRVGIERELHGYPEFDARVVLERLPELVYGTGYPTCVQLLVLQKPMA